MIVDQLKRKVPPEVKDHFIDEWCTITSPEILVERLDKYENVRGYKKKTIRQDDNASKKGFSVSKNRYTESQGTNPKTQSHPHQGWSNRRHSPAKHESRKFDNKVTCFSCKSEGHVKRNCPKMIRNKTDYDTRRFHQCRTSPSKEVTLSICFEYYVFRKDTSNADSSF